MSEEVYHKEFVGYRVKLDPNNKQKTLFWQYAGAKRWVYNWALAYRKELYEKEKKSINSFGLGPILTKLKKTDPKFTWLKKISQSVTEHALEDLDSAYDGFFRNIKNGDTPGFPKFKARGKSKNSFALRGDSVKIHYGTHLYLPKIGKVKLAEYNNAADPNDNYIPEGKIKKVTISEKCGEWYASCVIETTFTLPILSDRITGVDLNIKELATTSDGEVFDNPKALRNHARRIARLNRRLADCKPGGKNREKVKLKLAKEHQKVANIRSDALHKMTSSVVKDGPMVIVAEQLRPENMMKNHHIAAAISDIALGKIREMLEYKCRRAGIRLILADQWYPSSKCCSGCGNHKETLGLSERVYNCEACGLSIDRDYNASLNLKFYGQKWLELENEFESTGSISGIYALGDKRLQNIVKVFSACH